MQNSHLVRSMLVAVAVSGPACSSTTGPGSGQGPTGAAGSLGAGGGTARGGQAGAGMTSGATGGGTAGGAGSAPVGTGGATSSGGHPSSGGAAQSGLGGALDGGGATSSGAGGLGASGQPGAGGLGAAGAAASGGNGGASTAGSGGADSAGSGPSAGSAGTDGGGARSPGCGKTRTLQNGTRSIDYQSKSRKYILRVPATYDESHAYRLVFAFAESGASAQSVADRNYYTFASSDGTNTIFVAPDASDGAGTWSNTDVGFTDAILSQVEGDLCIDTTRIFATGFSFGAGMAMALACTRADVFRAVAFFSGADLTGSCPTTLTQPIAYYASQASQDSGSLPSTSPILGEVVQAKFAAVNGCTAEPSAANFPANGQPHTCTQYKGCSEGHPTEFCVFNGPHGWEPVDPGQTTSWDAPEAWKFITQF